MIHEEHGYATTAKFARQWLSDDMATGTGMNVSYTSIAMMVPVPGGRCGQPAVSDVLNGLVGRERSSVFLPIVELALRYSYLRLLGFDPIAPSMLGFADDNGLIAHRKVNGHTSGAGETQRLPQSHTTKPLPHARPRSTARSRVPAST